MVSNDMVSNDVLRDRWERAKLDELCDELLDGMSRIDVMLRFTLSHPALDTTIVGTRSIEHLRHNVAAAARGPLPDDVVAEAKRRLASAGAEPSPG